MVVSRLLQIVPLGKKLVKEKISLANYITVRSLSSTAVPNQEDKNMSVEWEEIGAAEANDYTPVHTFTEMGTPLMGKYKGQKEVKGGKFGDETHYIFATLDASTGAPYELAVNPNFDLRKRLTVATVC